MGERKSSASGLPTRATVRLIRCRGILHRAYLSAIRVRSQETEKATSLRGNGQRLPLEIRIFSPASWLLAPGSYYVSTRCRAFVSHSPLPSNLQRIWGDLRALESAG